MPCTITGSLDGDRTLYLRENLDELREQHQETNALLCQLLSIVEEYELYDEIPRKFRRWHKKHKEIDALGEG